jgi:Transglutaminase-like superfamily
MSSLKTLPGTACSRGETSTVERPDRQRPVERLGDFAEALTVAAITPLLMRLRPGTLARVLEPRRRTLPRDDARIAAGLRTTDAALWRGRPLVRPGCVSRGVTRYRMLRRFGVDVALCFGVGRIGDEIAAHCWLDLDGAPILEPEDVNRFIEMFRIRRPGVVARA